MQTTNTKLNKKATLSLIMRYAHSLRKNNGLTLSAALKTAWSTYKQNFSELKQPAVVSIFDFVSLKEYNNLIGYFTYSYGKKLNLDAIKTDEFIGIGLEKLLVNIAAFNPEKGTFKTFAAKVFHNAFIDFLRLKKNNTLVYGLESKDSEGETLGERFADTAPLQDAEFEQNEQLNAIMAVLETVTPIHREIFNLFYIEQKSYKEIEALTGVSSTHAAVYVQRTLKKVKSTLVK